MIAGISQAPPEAWPGRAGPARRDERTDARVSARIERIDESGDKVVQRVASTPGRLMIGRILPSHPQVPFDIVNRLLTKREVSEVIDLVYRHCGQKETVIFADHMMALGFRGHANVSYGPALRAVRRVDWCAVPSRALSRVDTVAS